MDEIDTIDDVEVSVVDTYGFVERGGPRRRRVGVTREGIVVDGTLALSRAEIASGALRPGAPHRVEIERRDGRTVMLGTKRLEDGRAILRALRMDGAHAAMTLRARSPAAPYLLMFLLPLLPLIGATGGRPWALVAAAMLALLAAFALMRPTMVTVGRDAVVIRWLGHEKVVRTASISWLHVTSDELQIRHGARTTSIPTGGFNVFGARESEDHAKRRVTNAQSVAAYIAERIEEARAAGEALEPGDLDTLPARGERDVDEWFAELRALSAAQSARDRAFVPERLWRLVRSPDAEPATRVAAAVALAPSLDADGQRDLRVLAEATASPRVRVALENVLDGDHDAAATALDALARGR